MPTETLTKNGRAKPEPIAVVPGEEEALRELAVERLKSVRQLKLYAAGFVLALLVLTPVWVVTEYMNADGWPERLSDNGRPGDWDPWILWVALAGGFILAVAGLKTYFRRPMTEAEIDREVERLKRH